MHKESKPPFLEFKSLLRTCEESQKSRVAHTEKSENVLKVNFRKNPEPQSVGSTSSSSVTCYFC
ncbi:hypothetical protein SK128_008916, partial [Halocaridina rubra]